MNKINLNGIETYNSKTVSLQTLGCKLNYAESSAIASQFIKHGFTLAENNSSSNVVVINSCTVTENADKECRQLVRRALRANPDTFVVVTGCYAQLKPEEIASIDGVDMVLGATEKFDVFKYESIFSKKNTPQIHVGDVLKEESFGVAFSNEADARTRAFLKIQDGCDYNCSFCTIPLARGGSRSQSISAAYEQAENLVRNGYKEIVITGVNVGDFGKSDSDNLYQLLLRLHDIEGLQRLRLSSIEPNLLTNDIIRLTGQSDRMMPHFHIPLQSGDNNILAKMRRRYLAENYRDRIDTVNSIIKNCAIGVDVIVGFPSESDKNFQNTFEFIHSLEISYLHVFTYSERINTPANEFKQVVPVNIRRERTNLLRDLSEKKKYYFIKKNTGLVKSVLFENSTPNPENKIFGWTENYIRVATENNNILDNVIAEVRLKEFNGRYNEIEILDVRTGVVENRLDGNVNNNFAGEDIFNLPVISL